MLAINSKRQSGIELLKVIALFLIIICHTYSSFATARYPMQQDIVFDAVSFTNIEYFIFQIFITFGYIGNFIFFVCSAWFLVDSKKNKLEKVIGIWINALIISILFLVIYWLLGYEATSEIVIKSFLPISSENNWYITTYIVFYLLYPFINLILNNLNKKQHFCVTLLLFVVYFIFDYFFIEKAFFKNDLIMFMVIYVIVAYVKKYMVDYCDDVKKNVVVLIVASLIFYTFIFINYAIMPIEIKWHVLNNPFFLFMTISLINIFRKFKIQNSFINTISALSLFVYLTHDNFLFRDSIRFDLVSNFIMTFETRLIVLEVLAFATLLFITCCVISYIYYISINKFINNISLKVKGYLNDLFV